MTKNKELDEILDNFIRECRITNNLPSYKEIENKNYAIFSLIKNNHKSLKKFSREYGIEDIYNSTINNKNRYYGKKPKSSIGIYNKECIKKVRKKIKKINDIDVFVGNIADLDIKFHNSTRTKFSVIKYLEENKIQKIPLYLYNFLKEIEDDKKNGIMEIEKYKKIINNSVKLTSYLYRIYKNDVLNKLLKEYNLTT